MGSTEWNAFFPYYAGYPSSFADQLITTADLPNKARVLDPWNGSGTSTYSAATGGYEAVGIDINPVMVVVARARLLNPSEADSLLPLAHEIVEKWNSLVIEISNEDPLNFWFENTTASGLRKLEYIIRQTLVGELARPDVGGRIQRISALASTFYVALFSLCRDATTVFRTSNPTWLKTAKIPSERLSICSEEMSSRFISKVRDMQNSILTLVDQEKKRGRVALHLGDSADQHVDDESIDIVLTSPPYCTRIDYTSATRVEFAVLSPLVKTSIADLGRKMIGSTRVPEHPIEPRSTWGPTCLKLLDQIACHPSKASNGYYKKTHLDYFDKLERAIRSFSKALIPKGAAVCVVQDSYYKEIHNDLAQIFIEIAEQHSLRCRRREDFKLAATLASSHPTASKYVRPRGATESVLCLEKI